MASADGYASAFENSAPVEVVNKPWSQMTKAERHALQDQFLKETDGNILAAREKREAYKRQHKNRWLSDFVASSRKAAAEFGTQLSLEVDQWLDKESPISVARAAEKAKAIEDVAAIEAAIEFIREKERQEGAATAAAQDAEAVIRAAEEQIEALRRDIDFARNRKAAAETFVQETQGIRKASFEQLTALVKGVAGKVSLRREMVATIQAVIASQTQAAAPVAA